MNRPHRKRAALLFVVPLVVLIAAPFALTWRQVRLNRALIAAIKRDDTASVLQALQAHADPNCRDTGGADPSFWRVLLLEWRRLRSGKIAPRRKGLSVLALAVEKNNSTMVKALIARGAYDVGDKVYADKGSWAEGMTDAASSLLMCAASHNNPEIVRLLVRHGGRINEVDRDGETALFYATGGASVQALLDCGINISSKASYGWTALDHSIPFRDPSVQDILLERGARDQEAMSRAISFDDRTAVKKMLDLGWKVDAVDEDGDTLLMNALDEERLQPDIAFLLIARGADVNWRDKRGFTPLMQTAVGGRYPEMYEDSPALMRALLQRGARINTQDNHGDTALMIAAWALRPRLVELLLRHGARVNLRSKDGSTALSTARGSPYIETQRRCLPIVVKLLKAAGART